MPEPLQQHRGSVVVGRKGERFRKVGERAVAHVDLPGISQTLKVAALWQRRKEGDGATSIGDLDRLTALHLAEQLTCALSQLSNPNADHVLFVAQRVTAPPSVW